MTVSTETAIKTIVNDGVEPSGLTELLAMPDNAMDTENEKDPTFDLEGR